jgi:hypothetical protein
MAVASVQDLSLGEGTRHFVLDEDQHPLLTILLIGRILLTRGREDHADRRAARGVLGMNQSSSRLPVT